MSPLVFLPETLQRLGEAFQGRPDDPSTDEIVIPLKFFSADESFLSPNTHDLANEFFKNCWEYKLQESEAHNEAAITILPANVDTILRQAIEDDAGESEVTIRPLVSAAR